MSKFTQMIALNIIYSNFWVKWVFYSMKSEYLWFYYMKSEYLWFYSKLYKRETSHIASKRFRLINIE